MLTSLIAAGIIGLQASPPQRQMACEFERTEPTPMKMKYWLYLPKEYASKPRDTFPLLLFLHGSGDSGDDLDQVKKLHGPPMLIDKGKDFPFIVVSPLDGNKTFLWEADVLHALLDDVEAKYRVDKTREYATGLSLGGQGTWAVALMRPNRFAAIAPVAGWFTPEDAPKIAHIPTWVFHGEKDTAVRVKFADDMVAALKTAKAKEVKYTLVKNGIHNVWTAAYADKALYDWFLKHRLSNR